MQNGSYLVVPFEARAEGGVPACPFALGGQVTICRRDSSPVSEWMVRVREYLTVSREHDDFARFDLGKSHYLLFRIEDEPKDPKEYFKWQARVSPDPDPIPRLRSELRLPSDVEHAFAALLIAERTFFHFSSCLVITQDADDVGVPAVRALGRYIRSRIGQQFGLAVLNARVLEAARVICGNLKRCPDDARRPVIAADMLYRAISENNWRVELLLLVSALESLFGSGGGEISHQVCERAASTVFGPGPKRLDAYRRLRAAYDIRSRFVHGQIARSDPEMARKAEAELDFVEEIARLSLRRILTDESLTDLFCTSTKQLVAHLEESVLAPGNGP